LNFLKSGLNDPFWCVHRSKNAQCISTAWATPKTCPIPWEILTQSNIWFLWPTLVSLPKRISIDSVVLANIYTDRPRYSDYSNRPHLAIAAMRPNKTKMVFITATACTNSEAEGERFYRGVYVKYRRLVRAPLHIHTARRSKFVKLQHATGNLSLNCGCVDEQSWVKEQTRRAAVYLGTHCNIGSKICADFPTGVLGR